MLWSLDMDDFRGAYCGKGRYPLLTSMVASLANSLPDVDVRLLDAVTWPHPDVVSYPMPTRTLPTISVEMTSARENQNVDNQNNNEDFDHNGHRIKTLIPPNMEDQTTSRVQQTERSSTKAVVITKQESAASIMKIECLVYIITCMLFIKKLCL